MKRMLNGVLMLLLVGSAWSAIAGAPLQADEFGPCCTSALSCNVPGKCTDVTCNYPSQTCGLQPTCHGECCVQCGSAEG
jgi:hypothetical protein